MKKSTYIDYAVLLAVLSGKKKKRREKIDRLLSQTLTEGKTSERQKQTGKMQPELLEIYPWDI